MNWVQATMLAPIYAERLKKRFRLQVLLSVILAVAAIYTGRAYYGELWVPLPVLALVAGMTYSVIDAVECRRLQKKLERA